MNTVLDVFPSSSVLSRTPTPKSFDLLIVHVAICFRKIYFVPMSSPRRLAPKNVNVLFTSSVAKKKKAIEKNYTPSARRRIPKIAVMSCLLLYCCLLFLSQLHHLFSILSFLSIFSVSLTPQLDVPFVPITTPSIFCTLQFNTLDKSNRF